MAYNGLVYGALPTHRPAMHYIHCWCAFLTISPFTIIISRDQMVDTIEYT